MRDYRRNHVQKEPYSARFAFVGTEELHNDVLQVAKDLGVSKAEVVRRACEAFVGDRRESND